MSSRTASLPVEVQAAVASARAAWPTLSFSEEAFAAHLATMHADPSLEAWAGLHVTDLYLARACVEGDPGAMAALEEKMWPEIDAALARVRLEPHQRQDVIQELRVQLLVGTSTRPAKIAQYRGQSELRHWLRAVALRDAYRVARKAQRELALDDVVLASVAVLDRDPGLAHLKELCRVELRNACAAALAVLPRSDRLLLRQHYLDRLTVDELAPLQNVHRATVARRIARVRDDLTSAILRDLGQRLQVSREELHSLMRLVRSQIDISLDRLLSVA
jgi:RNA polymerase sigma-70 factor, ECF subfamily